MTKTEKATQWMEATARNDAHGYDQTFRWNEKGDYDCSSAVYTAWVNAGIPVKDYSFKTYGCAYTGVMKAVFTHFKFKDVTSKVNLATGAGLQRGRAAGAACARCVFQHGENIPLDFEG